MRRNQFLTGAWGAVVAIALLVALAALIASSEITLVRRDRLTQALDPFDGALVSVEEDVYRVSIDTLGFLLSAPNSSFGGHADQSSARLATDLQRVEAAGRAAGFGPRAAVLAALAGGYDQAATEARALARAGNLEAARGVMERTAPDLEAFTATAIALDGELTSERDRLSASIRSIDRIQRVIIAGTVGLALASVLFLTLTSVNSQRLAETLRQRDERIEAIIAGVPGVVWEAWGEPDSATQRIDFVSEYVETMLGYTREEWLATPNFWLTIVHPEDRDRAAAEALTIFNRGRFANGRPGSSDFRWIAKDGRVLWVRAFSSVIRDAAGRPAGMRGVTLDISEQKQAEQALEAERGRLETMLRTLAYGVCEIDAEGRLVYLNAAGERLLGHMAVAIEGKQLHDTVHVVPSSGASVHPDDDCVFGAMRSLASPFDARDTFVRGNGTTFVADLIAAPVRVAGRTTGAVLAFQDVTERQRQEQLKDDYLSFASHELRTPLTVVSAMAQFLDRRASNDPTRFDLESREAIETLASEAERMVRLVEVFLDLARIESGRLIMEPDRVDLAEILAAEAEITRQIAPHVKLKLDAPTAFPAWTDETRLRQVLRNLLDNAAKHAGPHPHVELRLRADKGQARIELSDDGPGIPTEDLPHVFERLYRAASSQSQGLGAGLFIAREIVERLGGTIGVQSAPGAGTTFSVRLPLAPAAVE